MIVFARTKSRNHTYEVKNENALEKLRTEKDLFLRYFLWQAMVEDEQFSDHSEEFLCLLELVLQGSEANIHQLFNRGVLQNHQISNNIIRIGYSREIILQKMREFKLGNLTSIPERKTFLAYERAVDSSYQAVDLLNSISEEIEKMPSTELFDRLGAWIEACRNGVFSTNIQEIEWFIKYVIQQDYENLKKVYSIRPNVRYSESLMEKKLEQFIETGKITFSPYEKLENLQKFYKVSKDPDKVKKQESTKDNDNINSIAERLGVNTKIIEQIQNLISSKLLNDNEQLTLPILKEKSAFNICIEKNISTNPEKEISYFHKVVFLPLKKEGFFSSDDAAEAFFFHKMSDILDLQVQEIVQIARDSGIIFEEYDKKEKYDKKENYSEYFADNKTYEIYRRFREADFTSQRYSIVDSSKTTLYFLNMNHGFKEQKDLYFDLRSNAEVAKLNTSPIINKRKESDKDYELLYSLPSKVGAFSCFLVNEEEIYSIGCIEVSELNEIIHEYNLSYLLKVEYQGKLLGYCMARAMLDYIKVLVEMGKVEKPLRIMAIVHKDHMASIALLQKLGFKQIISPGSKNEKEFYARGMVCVKFALEV
jgi:RimJ/RimL family protein N-acetyltransferase